MFKSMLYLPRNLAIAFMRAYRRVISPLYGDVCKYYPSCSRYALEAYQQRSFFIATALVLWRLLRCNPFSNGGVDDVPAGKRDVKLTGYGFVIAAGRKE